MTVKDLIKQLEKMPQDSDVIVWNKEIQKFQDVKNTQFKKWDNDIKFVILHDEDEF